MPTGHNGDASTPSKSVVAPQNGLPSAAGQTAPGSTLRPTQQDGALDTSGRRPSPVPSTPQASGLEGPVSNDPLMTTPQPKDRRGGGCGSASRSCSFTSPFSPAAKLAISTRLPPALPVFDEAAPNEGFTIDVADLELGPRLAEGAYGVVWRGAYSGLDVAIKVQSVPAEDYEQVNILSELSILKNLRHERLVHYHGAALLDPCVGAEASNVAQDMWDTIMRGPEGDTLMGTRLGDEQVERMRRASSGAVPLTGSEARVLMVMELCANGALREGLVAKMEWPLKVRLAADIAEGLDVLHNAGLIHRDLKSSNILLDGQWRAKLCDHSFAIGELSPEMAAFTCGTTEFMAPEVILGEAYDSKADMFSFGVVLCELLCERLPGLENFLVREPKTRFELDPLEVESAALPGCPPSFLNLAMQCTKTDPELRPAAREAHDWLLALLTEMMGGDHMPVPLPVAKPPPPSPERRRDRARYRRRTKRSSSLHPPALRPDCLPLDSALVAETQSPSPTDHSHSEGNPFSDAEDGEGKHSEDEDGSPVVATKMRRGSRSQAQQDWRADSKLCPRSPSSSSSSSEWSRVELRRDVDGLLAWRERVDKQQAEHKASGGGEEAKEVRRLARRLEEVESLCIDMARTIRRHDKVLLLGEKGERGGPLASPLASPLPSPPRGRGRRVEREGEGRMGDAELGPGVVAAAAQWEAQLDALHASLKASLRTLVIAAEGGGSRRQEVVQGLESLEALLGGEGTRLVGAVTDSLQSLKECILAPGAHAPFPSTEGEGPRQDKDADGSPSRDHHHHHHQHSKHAGAGKRDPLPHSPLPPPPGVVNRDSRLGVEVGQLEKGARAEEKTILLHSQEDEALLSPPPGTEAPQPSNA